MATGNDVDDVEVNKLLNIRKHGYAPVADEDGQLIKPEKSKPISVEWDEVLDDGTLVYHSELHHED